MYVCLRLGLADLVPGFICLGFSLETGHVVSYLPDWRYAMCHRPQGGGGGHVGFCPHPCTVVLSMFQLCVEKFIPKNL